MKYLAILFTIIVIGCAFKDDSKTIEKTVEIAVLNLDTVKVPTCPKNHTDSIIPIIYGYPSQEMWEQSDSGLIAIGGCMLTDDNCFCTIHKISFKFDLSSSNDY